MLPPKHSRQRGVVLTSEGLHKLETAKAQAEIRDNAGKRYTLEELSFRTELTPNTLMKVLAGDVGVDKRTLSRCFRAFSLALKAEDYGPQPGNPEPSLIRDLVSAIDPAIAGAGQVQPQPQVDWHIAPDVSTFYGRSAELSLLQQWILQDRCRLVALCGMVGMGKTWLSVKLAEQIQAKFRVVVWRSLRHAPPIEDFLAQLIRALSQQAEIELASTIGDRISQLIALLRTSRCLVLLDNVETILQGNESQPASKHCLAGYYRPGYEGYGDLLRQIGEARHQSCLVLTSQEQPNEIRQLTGRNLAIRSFLVKGLSVSTIETMFKAEGIFHASTGDWHKLVDYYAGNPLLLKRIATTIQTVFGGNITTFLDQQTRLWGDSCHACDRQLHRLTDEETEILRCLAGQIQPASYAVLCERVSPSASKSLLETLESLAARSLVEPRDGHLLLQPFLVDYVKDHLPSQRYSHSSGGNLCIAS